MMDAQPVGLTNWHKFVKERDMQAFALPHENLTRRFGRHGAIRIGWWTLNGD